MDKSILLQKQVRDNSEDLQNEFLDMKNWEAEMKRKEVELKNAGGDQALPPIRSKKKKSIQKPIPKDTKEEDAKRIKSYDYASWDKFDVDKACQEVEEKHESNESDGEELSKEELEAKHAEATKYKEEGNCLVKKQQWNEAVARYSEAIRIFPYDAIFYANRALCHLRMDNLYSAEADCTTALQLDEQYVKAYHRRATARMELKQYLEAKQDLEKLLKLEPSNKEARAMLTKATKRIESSKSIIVASDDLAEDIAIEKKIGEKLCGTSDKKLGAVEKSAKSAELEAASTESVENISQQVQSSAKDIESSLEPSTSFVKSETTFQDEFKHFCLIGSEEDVAIVRPIIKPPHQRSKAPLKRITVKEIDHEKSLPEDLESTEKSRETNESTPSEEELRKNNVCEVAAVGANVPTVDDEEVPPVPKTAVQFIMNWKQNKSSNYRYKYLKQIPPGSLANIFQDSLESNIISDILVILNSEFTKRKEPIFQILSDLSNVKRFGALILFKSSTDEKLAKTLFEYCKTVESVPDEKIADLQRKFE